MRDLEDAGRDRLIGDEELRATLLIWEEVKEDKSQKFNHRIQLLKAMEKARRYGGSIVMPRKFFKRRMAVGTIQWSEKLEGGTSPNYSAESESQAHEYNCVSEGEGDVKLPFSVGLRKMKFDLCPECEFILTFHIHYYFATVPIGTYGNLHFQCYFDKTRNKQHCTWCRSFIIQ